MSLTVIVTLVFLLSVGAILGGFAFFAGRSKASLRRQVDSRLKEVSGRGDVQMPSMETNPLVKTVSAGPLPTVEKAAKGTARGSALQLWLEQSGLELSISGLLLLSIGVAAVLFFGGMYLGFRTLVVAGVAAVGALVPVGVVRHKRKGRLHRFEEHFPEALDLISRAVRAGHAFSAGLKMAAEEVEDPVGPEFRKAFDEQNYGLPLKESLDNLMTRVPLLDVRFFATAVLIQRDTGGNLAEILDNLAGVVRERFKILRQVRTHTAHGRLTGYVLMALPAFLAVALSFINPDHMNQLFRERVGHMLITAAIIMQAIGYVWIKRVVKIEV